MLACGAPGFDYYSGYQESWMSTNRIEQNDYISESLNGIHMLIVLLEEKVLQNEQELSHLQRIIWKLEQENDSFRERLQRLEASVAELWQCNTSTASNDSGTYSEISSELFEDRDHNDLLDNQSGGSPLHNWTSSFTESALPGYDALNSQLFWPSSQPVLCYFYGVPAAPPFVNNETVFFDGQETTNSSTYYYGNAYNV
ncbi:Protein of unknown function [Gryllus bimaculatus]|nr:Protein of unknown function [Gryllus bimaculatus]